MPKVTIVRKSYPSGTKKGGAYRIHKVMKPLTTPRVNRAIRIANIVDRAIERKFFDYDNNGQSISNTPVVLSLTGIAQGITDTTRTGDAVSLQSIDFSLDCASTTVQSFRIILFYWNVDDSLPGATPPGIGPPVVGSVLMPPANPSSYPIVKYRVDNRRQFTIIADRTWALDAGQALNKIIRIRKNLKKHRIQFTAGSTSGSGKIYGLLMSDGSSGGACNIYARTKYLDM